MLSVTGPGLAVTLGDERATRRLAIDLASVLKPGDTVTLSGISAPARARWRAR